MRLLSFLSLVETHLNPGVDAAQAPWHRRVNYTAGRAICWHPAVEAHLRISQCELADGRHNVFARWCAASGDVLKELNFFCRHTTEWESSASTIAQQMPTERAEITPLPSSSESSDPVATEPPRQSAIA